MYLWRIYPIAIPSDGRWQGRKIWSEVVVRAPTAAIARLKACQLEGKGSRLTRIASCGFEDEKLYWVQRLNEEDTAKLEDHL
jgi:hypothetical protein